MDPTCLKSQDCHLIPRNYLLSYVSAKSYYSFCLVIFLLMVHSPDFFQENSQISFVKSQVFLFFYWLLLNSQEMVAGRCCVQLAAMWRWCVPCCIYITLKNSWYVPLCIYITLIKLNGRQYQDVLYALLTAVIMKGLTLKICVLCLCRNWFCGLTRERVYICDQF